MRDSSSGRALAERSCRLKEIMLFYNATPPRRCAFPCLTEEVPDRDMSFKELRVLFFLERTK